MLGGAGSWRDGEREREREREREEGMKGGQVCVVEGPPGEDAVRERKRVREQRCLAGL